MCSKSRSTTEFESMVSLKLSAIVVLCANIDAGLQWVGVLGHLERLRPLWIWSRMIMLVALCCIAFNQFVI